jgi:hypothetical protein
MFLALIRLKRKAALLRPMNIHPYYTINKNEVVKAAFVTKTPSHNRMILV